MEFQSCASYRNILCLIGFVFCITSCSKPVSNIANEAPAVEMTSNALSIPDYSSIDSWAAHADRPGASAMTPPGSIKRNSKKDVDVFYIHPTVYRSDSNYNQTITDVSLNKLIDGSVIARQASVFNDCCNVFAPRYRAASFLATSDRFFEGRGAEAYDLAYSDVLRAFDLFRAKENKDRPFIIAGHSQGALMVSRLLKDRVDNKPAQEQMIAAYTIGFNLSVGEFGKKYKTLQPCNEPLQTGCVLCWNAVTPDANLDLYAKMGSALYVRNYDTEEGKEILCINPLTFDSSNPDADQTFSKGAIPGAPGMEPLKAMQQNKLSASAQRGYLVVTVDSTLDLTPLPGGSLHYHEFGMFYEDIRQNIAARIAAHKKP